MNNSPRHVAIIMDGNGRWAERRLMPRTLGHVKGAANLKDVVRACFSRGISYLTVFAFSTENWKRPPGEVALLFDLFAQYLNNEFENLRKQGVRLRIIGDRSAFPDELVREMQRVESLTAANQTLQLTVAVNYGGKWDIVQAVKDWQHDNPYATVDQLTPSKLEGHLSTAGLPEPDLLIRTGGESRLSNFLIWQGAYSELYFSPEYWPDFNAASLDKALRSYGERVRRFGKTDEQIKAKTQPSHH
jgi:undecaprenyl diphosphate synthase